jgi:predicted nucleic acid-binding protein
MKAGGTRRFVLDASVAVAWCFEDEGTKFTEGVLDLISAGVEAEALVPSIWPLEVANALLMAERRKRIALAKVTGLLARIAGLPISVRPAAPKHAFEQILPMARQQGLSQYDAAYLELAVREGLALATLDGELQRAAKAVGVELLSV